MRQLWSCFPALVDWAFQVTWTVGLAERGGVPNHMIVNDRLTAPKQATQKRLSVVLRRPQNSAKINTYLRSNAKSVQGVSSQGEVFPHCLQRRKSLIFNPYHGIFSFVLSNLHVDRFEKRMFPVWGIPRTEYDALIESAYFPVYEVMGLSPIP